jgi:hypothetical protein
MHEHNNITNEKVRLENSSYNEEWIKKNKLVGHEIISVGSLDVEIIQKTDSKSFQVAWLKNIDRLITMLPSNFDFKTYTLVDVGCDSGISTLYFYQNSKFKNLVGFDFSKKLIDSAENNKRILFEKNGIDKNKKINFSVCDALNFKIHDKVCMFMFNPFGAKTIINFVQYNINILSKTKSFLLYANDLHINEISNFSELYKRDDYYNLSVSQF